MVLLTVGFVVVAIVPRYLSVRDRYGTLLEASNKAKEISGALRLFRKEYGSFPNQRTREVFLEKGHRNLMKEDHANAYLAQLIVGGFLQTEATFFVPEIQGVEKGDEQITAGSLLAAGENAFSYVMLDQGKSLGDGTSLMPLVMTPVTQGGITPLFDPAPFGGKYVYGSVGGAAIQGDIDEDGLPMSMGRAHLFEAGRDSLFGTDIPVVKMPLLK